jgi:hypothetical protein
MNLPFGLGSVASGLASSIFDQAAQALASGLSSAAGDTVGIAVSTLADSAPITFTSGWWSGPAVSGSGGVWPTVLSLAGGVLLVCVLLTVIQGALAGEPGAAVRALAVEVPKAILGMSCVCALCGLLVNGVDAASAQIVAPVAHNLSEWEGAPVAGAALFLPSIGSGVILVGSLLVWLELVVRQGMIYLLVALSPLAFALRVWPPAAAVWRRLCEIGVALIVSKLVIAIAFALGTAALAGGGLSPSANVAGGGLLLVSAFSPFVVLRLIPGVEGALVAQGVKGIPTRAASSAAGQALQANSLRSLAAGAGGVAGPGAAGSALLVGGSVAEPGPSGPGAPALSALAGGAPGSAHPGPTPGPSSGSGSDRGLRSDPGWP